MKELWPCVPAGVSRILAGLCAAEENDPIIDLNIKQRAATVKHINQGGEGGGRWC